MHARMGGSSLRAFLQLFTASRVSDSMASLYDSYGFPILEKGDELTSDLPISEQQVERQRPKWAAFMKARGGISSEKEPWLWKYWKTGSRSNSQITKKFLSMVGTLGIPSNRAAQRDLKKLIRKGVPPELRSEVWYV